MSMCRPSALTVATLVWLASPAGSEALKPELERRLAVAKRFAPVFIQAVHPFRAALPLDVEHVQGGTISAYEDYFLRVNFDRDWNVCNNVHSLARLSALSPEERAKRVDLVGAVYFAVQETRAHYFLHYAYYHVTDPKTTLTSVKGIVHKEIRHVNDFEGALVVVRKAANAAEDDIDFVVTMAHNHFVARQGSGLLRVASVEVPRPKMSIGEGTHVVLVSQIGNASGTPFSRRGLSLNDGHGTQFPDTDTRVLDWPAILYVPVDPTGQPEDVPNPDNLQRTYPYRLISLTGDLDGDGAYETPTDPDEKDETLATRRGLWDLRSDPRVFGSYLERGRERVGIALNGDDAVAAKPPWAWESESGRPGENCRVGTLFLDPLGAFTSDRSKVPAALRQAGVRWSDSCPSATASCYTSNVFLKSVQSVPIQACQGAVTPPQQRQALWATKDDRSCPDFWQTVQKKGVLLDRLPLGGLRDWTEIATLAAKYRDSIRYLEEVAEPPIDVSEGNRLLRITATVPDELARVTFWNRTKRSLGSAYDESELVVDLRCRDNSRYGTYFAQANDSLSKISKSLAGQWTEQELCSANRKSVKDCNLIRKDQRIVIPLPKKPLNYRGTCLSRSSR